MEMKQNHTFFHETYLNLTPYLFLLKILKYFNDFQNRKFSSFMTKVNPKNGMEQNQTFYHWTYSNLTLFFIGRKLLKYFNEFYN